MSESLDVMAQLLNSAGADQLTMFLGLWAIFTLVSLVIFGAVVWVRMR
jgi:hypothetical protein